MQSSGEIKQSSQVTNNLEMAADKDPSNLKISCGYVQANFENDKNIVKDKKFAIISSLPPL